MATHSGKGWINCDYPLQTYYYEVEKIRKKIKIIFFLILNSLFQASIQISSLFRTNFWDGLLKLLI